MENLGRIILQLREERGISQRQLGRGLADDVEMSRLENGAKEADCFLLEALFQRLGKTVDKFELMMSNQEYRMLLLRTLIMESLRQEEYESANLLLEEYGKQSKGGKPLHRQFRQGMEAFTGYIGGGDRCAALRDMQTAVEITCPLWREENLAENLLCAQEIQMLLLMLALLAGIEQDGRIDGSSAEDMDLAERKLWELMRYLEEGYTDVEAQSRIYPQCAWALAKLLCARSDFRMAWETAEKGIKCLTDDGILTVMDGLLEVQEHCRDKTDRQEEDACKTQARKAIAFLYQISGERMPANDICSLLLTSENRELIIDGVLLKEMRLSQGMTQEELSEDICAPETLLRIEGGKRKPNRKNLYKMYRKMGLEREQYHGYIQSDDFSLYEKVRKVMSLWTKGKRDEAVALVAEMEEQLDMTLIPNRQFIETFRLINAAERGELAWEKAFERAEQILKYTMKDYQGIVYRIPFRIEGVILNFMARCLRSCGKLDEAIVLLEQTLDRFRKGTVSLRHHTSSVLLIFENYPGILEICNRLDQSEKAALEGIKLALKCQRGDTAATILANLSCVYEKRSTQEDTEICMECLRNSFYLLRTYKYGNNAEVVRNHYEKIFGEELV